MRKINYPTDIATFSDEYYNSLLKTTEGEINHFLSGIPLIFPPITFKDLVTENFEDLIGYSYLLETYFSSKSPTEVERFKSLFNYSKNQPFIADFFMNKKDDLEMKTCFYCNIDFINSFNDIGEYENEIDFINKATLEELKIILGGKKAESVYKELRIKNISKFDELKTIKGIGKETIKDIKLIKLDDLKKYKNHFTLDHFMPQSKYPYFSLNLFNLIPSCYSCNSKFKGAMVFKDIDNLKYLSPSSNLFSLNSEIGFKLYFNTKGKRLETKIKNTRILNDIRVDFENMGSVKEFDVYLDMFKLKGRYVYHKNEAMKLVKKRKDYPDSELNEIAKLTGRHVLDIKKDIFGSLIFNDDEKNEPFAKYKREIAEQLGLL
ncbi:hypothetical protein SAMN05443633_1263 [Chryseobacterium arachidis]|uniref:Uncharacterized protein n=2 Tax=Chryseobacterium arachidis TaxID=1416778 RepID=A0A1M5MV19_9FLAO|nr:hypothetical protein [Chryseobacterium arachidis]SHG81174.1 hypothetical protein SAMN05443633_1263 [Chryseobacterium arachidis]